MRVTRSSMSSTPVLREKPTKCEALKTGKVVKRKPSLPINRNGDKKRIESTKRKYQSLPAAAPKLKDDDQDDVLSVHSDGEAEPAKFNFNCIKCKKKFVKRSYFIIHLQLAHSIDLRPLTALNGIGNRQAAQNNTVDIISPMPAEASIKHNDFDCVVIDDEDYYSCDSLILDSEKGSVTWNDESDLDVESIFDESFRCTLCDSTFELQILLDTHVCLLRNLSPEHRDIVKNQPYVELRRLRSARKNRRQLKFSTCFVCPICAVRFATDVDMMIHAQNEHRVDPNLMKFASNNISASGDPKLFLPSSKSGVYQRDCIRKSKSKKPDLAVSVSEKLPCSLCSRAFTTKNRLDSHMEREHYDKKPTKPKKKYDHNNDPIAKALCKRDRRLGKGDPKVRVTTLMSMLGLSLQRDASKYV